MAWTLFTPSALSGQWTDMAADGIVDGNTETFAWQVRTQFPQAVSTNYPCAVMSAATSLGL